MSEFPFLDQTKHPCWSKLTSDRIKPEITHALDRAEKNLDKIRSLDAEAVTFQNTIKALELATEDLSYAWGLVGHLDAVCNSPELRDAHNEMLPTVSAFSAKIPLDPQLWQSILDFSQTEEAKSLPAIDHRLLEETLADFREAGADLPEDKKNRLEELSSELAQTTQKFSEKVLDATNNWQIVIKEEAKLMGLPQTAKEAAHQTAIEKLGEEDGKNAWILTLHAPSLLPALQYLEDDDLRKEIWSASNELGCQPPFDNQELVADILRLRQEKAQLLGKTDFSEVALSRRMAKCGKNADDFVSDLHQKNPSFFPKRK